MQRARLTIDTPLGPAHLTASDAGLTEVRLGRSAEPGPDDSSADARHHARRAARALDEFFAGRRSDFAELALAPEGTRFQRDVWNALRGIPCGETATYAEIAARVGRPAAARAVGQANHHNPLAVVVPCHRVVGANGALTGYAGGLDRKRWLLAHEFGVCRRDGASRG